MNKNDLRKKVMTKLKKRRQKERRSIELNMLSRLIESSFWKNAHTIGVTIATSIEWDTNMIIKQAWNEGKTVAIPKCLPKTKQLIFYSIKSFSELESGYAQLLEPNPQLSTLVNKNDIDLLIVPGIVFDKRGYRIGFGGGYYDRFLKNFHNTTMSLVGDDQFIDKVPINEYDIPVQYLITEKAIVKAKNE